MNKREFKNYYSKELDNFRKEMFANKDNIKQIIRTKLGETGYDEIITYKEHDLGKKKN